MSFNGRRAIPHPVNEPIQSYAPGTPARAELKARLSSMAGDRVDIPLVIGGREVRTGHTDRAVMPHLHGHVLGDFHTASPEHVDHAIAAALEARHEWASWPWEERAAVFLKAADLAATTWRSTLNAATMLGQSKTAFQAEIDSACEVIDFWRYNPWYAQQIYEEQPVSAPGMWNQLDYRGLEGFVYAITPFNFTAIGANLPTAPALMGCSVVWKPAHSAMLSAYHLYRLLEEAGLPPGVINLVSGDAVMISERLLSSRALAGVHFTGSTTVFNSMWKTIGASMSHYRNYPRIVGETGGKDFIVAHASADVDQLAVAIVRAGFEYQGQKCSAASRVYVPKLMWPALCDRVVGMMDDIRMGDVRDFRNFMGAVIDRKAFDRITGYVEHARVNATILAGGTADASEGFFVSPTLVETNDPGFKLLQEEIFGPVVTVYPYDDGKWLDTLALVDQTSPYALTGSIFARDRRAVLEAGHALRNAAGNFYINDKPTGAVVGQQPFGGARASGTNDKAGSKWNLMRWASPRTVKETFNAPTRWEYPFMDEE
jgi:1-pyrroline-5-carboxylate dehydrogenase